MALPCARGRRHARCLSRRRSARGVGASRREQFNEPSEIAGAVVSVRKQQAKLCLWTRTEQNQAVQTAIAMQLKRVSVQLWRFLTVVHSS